jgi:uncharacterized protein (DUF362 family)
MLNRREFLGAVGAAGVTLLQPARVRAAAPTAPVAIGKCKSYGPEFVAAMDKMFDQIGGIGNLVRGKTVSIKINMTGSAETRLGYLPAGRTHWTHPLTVGGIIHLLDKYGARRIRVLEGEVWPGSLEEWMAKQGWDPDLLLKAAPRVELVNTNLPYKGKKPYTRFPVPHGGLIFPAWDLNTAYAESDVLISMAKIKEHLTAGFTLSIKNLWGVTPCTIYGNKAPVDEPGLVPWGGRQDLGHNGKRQPPKSSPPEKDPNSPRDSGYRIPRIVAELSAAVPVDLAILEGIESITGSEIPYARYGDFIKFVSPGVVAVGRNCVTTDAVGMAMMGFDPMADRGAPPFELCDNTLRYAEELGVGTRDLKNIEVIGTPIKDVVFDFRKNGGPRPAGVPGGPPLPVKK